MFEDDHLEFEYESRNGSDVDTADEYGYFDDGAECCVNCGFEFTENGECDCA